MSQKRVARAPLSDLLSSLPSVDRLLTQARAGVLIREYGRDEVVRAVRDALESARLKLRSGMQAGAKAREPDETLPDALPDALLDDAAAALDARRPRSQPPTYASAVAAAFATRGGVSARAKVRRARATAASQPRARMRAAGDRAPPTLS